MKTYSPKPRDIERRWYVIDASGAVLGRLATEAAAILRGKHKPIFAPHMDTGDHLIVVNAREVRLTGGKEEKKVAYRHSGYPGGLTETTYARLLAERPVYAVEKAIKGMLPKNRLGRAMAGKLKVYAGPEHRHEAQQPRPLQLGQVPRWDGLPARAAEVEPGALATEPAAGAATKSTAKKSTAKKAGTAKKAATAKKSTAKKSTARKSTAKKSTAKKAGTAKKAAPAKKSTPRKSTAKKSTAKKSTAKKTTARRTKKES